MPVYELARRPDDDQPFYTMRLVRGETRRDRIRDFHERKKAGTADPLELPRLELSGPILARAGYNVQERETASAEDVECGLKSVHNDAC